jgi:glycosyltransferase involved in cell wall biosynthesis
VNKNQQKVLNRYYHVPYSKIEIIPHLIEDKYFEIPHFAFNEKYQVENYVLCTGNISSRKNQCNLALACINLNASLVLIGKVLDGESAYGNKLEKLCSSHKNIVWIKELPNASEELVTAYYNCLIFALPSKNETQPISALEAVAMKKPIVLLDRKYAYQDYYKGAFLCKSQSVGDIEKTLISALNSKGIIPGNNEILNCKEERVGRSYKKCYEKMVRKDLY